MDGYSKKLSIIKTITESKRDYYWLDIINLVFITITLVFQMLIQISPIMSFIAMTPFYSMQTYLGIFGGILIVIDVFTAKRLWQGKYSVLLFGIAALAAVASIRMISYGVSENLFILCWSAIYFAVFYSCVYRKGIEKYNKAFTILFIVFLAIWLVACIISLYQFFAGISYYQVINPLSKDSSAFRQGYCDDRLFGIFGTLNHAAYISLFFFFICLVCGVKIKNTKFRIFVAICDFILICHIVLTKSRSAMIALFVGMFVLAWLVVRNISFKFKHQTVWPIVAAVVILAISMGVYSSMRSGFEYIAFINPLVSDDDKEIDDNLLFRDGVEGDVSNGRTNIWLDYLSIYKEVGLTGISPGNYMSYILENHDDLFIVENIKLNYPAKYESGIIYHPHNGYLYVFIGSGIIGAACLISFIALCAIKVFKKLMKSKQVSGAFICAFVLVVVGAISSLFDTGLFFQNNPHSSVFWIAAGVLMKECSVLKAK